MGGGGGVGGDTSCLGEGYILSSSCLGRFCLEGEEVEYILSRSCVGEEGGVVNLTK